MRFSPPAATQRARSRRHRGRPGDGTIDALCSTTHPWTMTKSCLPFAEASPGATGLELLLR